MTSAATPKPKRRGPTPEALVQRAIVQFLRACRLGTVRRVNVGVAWMGGSNHAWGPKGRPVRFGELGHSDLVLELDGTTRCVFIECKAPGGRPTQLQLEFLERQRQRGHLAFVARSVQDVERELRAAGFELPVSSQLRRVR